MNFKTFIEIDLQEALSNLNMGERRRFLKNEFRELPDDDLIEALRQRGYNVTRK